MAILMIDGFDNVSPEEMKRIFAKEFIPRKGILTRYGKKKLEEIKNVCTCTIETLMKHGCQCGQFQREMRLKNESVI